MDVGQVGGWVVDERMDGRMYSWTEDRLMGGWMDVG